MLIFIHTAISDYKRQASDRMEAITRRNMEEEQLAGIFYGFILKDAAEFLPVLHNEMERRKIKFTYLESKIKQLNDQ